MRYMADVAKIVYDNIKPFITNTALYLIPHA